MKSNDLWRPCSSLETMRARARLQRDIRAFFQRLDVLEIDTPALSRFATVDPNIDSFFNSGGLWLQTSQEFAMKRLLAAGSGAIFQIAHVFRREEAGRHHNPEFTLLEWYRPGWEYRQLMKEVAALLAAIGAVSSGGIETLTYREAFECFAEIDPFTADIDSLIRTCGNFYTGLPEAPESSETGRRDFYLDLLMSAAVSPKLGLEAPVFVCDFPASQAALARIRPGNPPVAERFELFWKGIELANGFSELVDANEQRRRFEQDQARRRARGQKVPPYDEYLIAALESGMPASAGVALGIDRLLMLMLGLDSVAETLTFDFDRA